MPEPVASDTQPVRTHTVLGRLLQIQFDGVSVLSDTDRHAESVASLTWKPAMLRIEPRNVSYPQHLAPRPKGSVVVSCVDGILRCRTERCDATAERLRQARRRSVRPRKVLNSCAAHRADLIATDDQSQTTRRHQPRAEPAQVEDGHRVEPGFGQQAGVTFE